MQPNYKGVKHEYMKAADINNFDNYSAMITDKFLLKTCNN